MGEILHDNAQKQELRDVERFLEINRNEFSKYKILYDTIQQCVKNKEFEADLNIKLKNMFLAKCCKDVLPIESNDFNQKGQKLLGITSVPNVELKHDESKKLKKVIENHLEINFQQISNSLLECGCTEDFQSDSYHQLNEIRSKFLAQKDLYIKNLLHKHKILEGFEELRIEKLRKVAEKKVEDYKLTIQINELKTNIIEEKSRVAIFTETSHSLKAYKEVISDINEQQLECEQEIKHLSELKKKYQEVSCQQFDDILKSYIAYKNDLEKKKTFLQFKV